MNRIILLGWLLLCSVDGLSTQDPGLKLSNPLPSLLEKVKKPFKSSQPIAPSESLVHTAVELSDTNPSNQEVPANTNPTTVSPAQRQTEETFPKECEGKIIFRKEIREMKADGDLDGFIQAFKALAQDGTLTRFVEMHQFQGTRYMHGLNPRFLPWHRVYLNMFEQELIKKGAKYLPYWDWTQDNRNLYGSVVFTNDYFGTPDPARGYTLKNSAFSADQYVCPQSLKPITRYFDTITMTSTPIYSSYELDAKVYSQTTYSLFSNELNTLHGGVHWYVGRGSESGEMGTMTSIPQAPQDPLFWLHHTFIDKVWDTWQDKGHKWDYDVAAFDGHFQHISIDDIMEPFDHQPTLKSTFKLENACITYSHIAPKKETEPLPEVKPPPDEFLEKHGFDKNKFKNETKEANEKANEEIKKEKEKKKPKQENQATRFAVISVWISAALILLF